MKIKAIGIFLFLIFIHHMALAENPSAVVATESVSYFDSTRHRNIPVEIYKLKKSNSSNQSLVIISQGYTVKNTEYSFIAKKLAEEGYFVVSIQHDLKQDHPLPKAGNVYQRRKPLWVRGVDNIVFVIDTLKQKNPHLDFKKIILIGHSNGGDISMLFAQEHPQLIKAVVSLDSLRMPFPKNKNIKLLSIRANDTMADEGVIPSNKEQKKLSMQIISLKNAKHIDLCDRGLTVIKNEINDDILKFLKINNL